MSKAIKHLVVVGGGSAGWLSAGIIAAKLNKQYQSNFKVTLVESPNVPIVGVGEGTWPTMRRSLMEMGVNEAEFIKFCNVSFKQGAKFAKWVTGEEDDAYYHSLELPKGFENHNLAEPWLFFKAQSTQVPDFATSVCQQASLCDLGLSPKLSSSPEYQGEVNYAYHLDAGKFSHFLREHCTNQLGIEHVLADIELVNSDDNGDIKSLIAKCGREIKGDFFIDCSGFASLLIGQHYKIPFKACDDVLFVDSALAVQVPYQDEQAPIASHTISTAQSAGWIWDIGLSNRRGVGHVYSSKYISQEQAKKELIAYLGDSIDSTDELVIRQFDIKPGHRERFWQNNCCAIGLSAGFLEPLEASALLLIEISARFIAEQFPASRAAMDVVAERFNQIFLYRWQSIIDFLKLHYLLTKRQDTAFWRDQHKQESIPDTLKQSLALWQYQSPWHSDFTYAQEVFPAASYQYILYGMGFETKAHPLGLSQQQLDSALRIMKQNAQETQNLANKLSTNRVQLNRINGLSE